MHTTFDSRHGHFYKSLIFFSLLFCLILLATFTHAAGTEDNTFYDKTRQGWFWYEDPRVPQEKPNDRPETIPHKTLSLDAYAIEDLWNMHPDDFQNLLNGVQKQAVQFPSEQNVLEYLTIQDIARRKALAYTHTASYVTQKYSNLFGMNQVYPTAGPGVTARVQMQRDEIAETIGQGKADHALLFFINPRCSYCDKQKQILAYFIEKYAWQIRIVDTDKEPDAAMRFNITVTPTLLLIKKGHDQSMPIASGVVTLSELERKLYQAIRYLQGARAGENFLLYDFQKDSALDPTSILGGAEQPWKPSK
jgi:conjugal transfer pilus assembly protein TraF